MALKLIKQKVGPWPMNSYVVICEETKTSAMIDPGADAATLLGLVEGTNVEKILLTHGHGDHVGALEAVVQATGAPVYLHPADAEHFGLNYDHPLSDGDEVKIGNYTLRVSHTPGHTPGQVCFDLGDGNVVVGDTLFVGGPGKTWSAEDFATTMQNLQAVVFQWADETQFHPGHGPSGVIGEERPAFEGFAARGWPDDLYGDVTWE